MYALYHNYREQKQGEKKVSIVGTRVLNMHIQQITYNKN